MKTLLMRLMTVSLASATVFAFVACSKSSDGSTASAAAVGTTTSAATLNAQCNSFDSSSTRFGGRIATYYDTAQNFVEASLRVRITTLTSSFDTNNYAIQFFRWKSDASGNATLDSTPLTFTVYYNSQPISAAMTYIDATTVASLRSSTGIGTSSTDFFNRTTLVVTGVDNSWQVLKEVLYNGTTPVTSTDTLMPLFLANPNSYASTHPALLNGLHPFVSQAGNGYTDAQWVSYSNQNCFQ